MSYSQEALNSALEEIKLGSSLRAAAKKYNVPVTTLHDHKSGKVAPGAKKGKDPLLPLTKEKELIEYAIKRADMGIGFSKSTFLSFAGQYAASEGVYFKGRIASEKWWRGFKIRHPNFSLRTAESTATGRHMSMTRFHVSQYFSELKNVLTSNYLINKSQFIWNMDETGLSMSPKPPKVIARKGSKTVHAKSSNSREMITIIACGNAAGTVIPPHVIVPGKTKRALLSYDTGNAPVGTKCSVSDSGWTKQGISELWFTESFIPNIGHHRPQLLVVDGHDSHHHVEIIGAARKERIIIIELPSKTSHFTQPFDRSVFKSFKTSWARHVQDFISETGVAVGHSQFFRIMKKAWTDALTSGNVSAGFVATGICPFNPGVIPDHAYLPADLYMATPLQDQSDESPCEQSVANTPICDQSVDSSPICDQSVDSTPINTNVEILPESSLETHTDTDVLYSFDIHGSNQVVDLPVSLDESGMLMLLEEQLETQSGNDPYCQLILSDSALLTKTGDHNSTLSKSDAALALSVVESAIPDDKKELYQNTYDSGNTLDDSMYNTWAMYKSQLSPKPTPISLNSVPSNPMLVLPKQEYKKPTKKNKYFVVTSDECFKSKLEEKVKKEKKNADLQERKRQRQLKREMKEKYVGKKIKKEKE